MSIPPSSAETIPPTVIPASSDTTVASEASSITASVHGRSTRGGGRVGRGRGRGRGRSNRGGGGSRTPIVEPQTHSAQIRGETQDIIVLQHLSERPKKDQFLVFQS